MRRFEQNQEKPINPTRESFFTAPESRYYKEDYKQGKNVNHTMSSYNPLDYNQKDESEFTPKLRRDMQTSNTIFGEKKDERPEWLERNHMHKKPAV
mmetsp:Transcript_16657/g.28367  ORF Transcript_16657/g.28367 Transcript_16657/m.28367 type:complete len:96 (-) Transcript_16657:376-663(-)